jgi:hypothetical protein
MSTWYTGKLSLLYRRATRRELLTLCCTQLAGARTRFVGAAVPNLKTVRHRVGVAAAFVYLKRETGVGSAAGNARTPSVHK